MRRQRNTIQTKEEDKPPEKELSAIEKKNLPAKEFKIMITKIKRSLRED